MDINVGLYFWIILTVISSLTIIYWYLTRKFNYWTKRGVKGPKPWPLFGNNVDIITKAYTTYQTEWYKKYGKIYGVYNKTDPILVISDPVLIKNIMVKDFNYFTDHRARIANHEILDKHLFASNGDDWRRLRSIISPTFTSGKMKKMFSLMRECVDEFIEHLDGYAKDRKSIALKDMHINYTINVISTCAFANKTNGHKDPNNPLILFAKNLLEFSVIRMLTIMALPLPVLKLLQIKSRRKEDSNQYLIDLTKNIVKQRKSGINGNRNYNDFIQLIVEAEKDKDTIHDEDNKDEAHHANEGKEELEVKRKTLSLNVVNKRLTEDEIAAQGWIFFVAGYETTATLLTFLSYELALNPEIQEQLYQEIKQSMDSEGEISYEKLSKLPYLDSTISEALRMYPPVPRLERKCLSDYKLGETGITISKGMEIEFYTYPIHHSEEFYPNPEQFNPDRFMPENRHNIIPFTYLPFGSGPRHCIGMRFALLEAKLGLAHILKRYRLFRTNETAVPLVYKSNTGVLIAESVVVGIENRE